MTIKIQTEEADKRQLTLTVAVDEARVDKAMRKKARELAGDLKIPGFRQGKAPYSVMVRRIGKETLRAEAIEELVQPVFEEAMTEADVEPYGQPSLESIEPEPLALTFKVPLPPVATLGDYRALRKEIEPVVITEEALAAALEQMQIRHQTLEAADRPVQEGDLVTLSGVGDLTPQLTALVETGDEADTDTATAVPDRIFDEESLDLIVARDKMFPNTPFFDHILGLAAGDEAEFSFTFPEAYEQPELAGREANFKITVLNVQKRDLPALDDELAKLEGRFETLDELRENLRKDLQRHAEGQAKEELLEGLVDDLLAEATLVYPPAAIESEIDQMLQTFKNQISRSGWNMEDYLKMQGGNEESLRADFRERAEERLRRNLALRQFMLDEKVRVDIADIEALIEERVDHIENEDLQKSMRDFYRGGQGIEAISAELLSNKVYERAKAIYSGDAPDLAALEAMQSEANEEE